MEQLLYGIPVLSDKEEKEFGGASTLSGLSGSGKTSDIYQIITNMIVEKIESAENLVWQEPWKSSMSYGMLPTNFVSKKEYRGANAFLLQFLHNRENPYWLTFNQITKLKGNIKKGAKSAIVVYYRILFKNEEGEIIREEDATEDDEKIPMLRYYRIFNGDDIEGIDWKLPNKIELSEHEKIESAERIVTNMPNRPVIKHSNKLRAYYSSADYVHMPNMELFNSAHEYYSTLFHELTHSTKHPSRLGTSQKRKGGKRFGDKYYALEELVAEMGASFLCAESGILYYTLNNSAAYIKSWKKAVVKYFKDDKKAFFTACTEAQRSTDYILDRLAISVEQRIAINFQNLIAGEVGKEESTAFINEISKIMRKNKSRTLEQIYAKGVKLHNSIGNGKVKVALKDREFANLLKKAAYVPVDRSHITKKGDKILKTKPASRQAIKQEKKESGIKKLPEQLELLFSGIDAPPSLSGVKREVMQLPGDLGKFLGKIERLQYALLLRGEKGAGKTRLTYQLMNLFASQNYSVAAFTLEIMKESDLVRRMMEAYILPENRKQISIASEAPNGIDTVREAAKYFDVVVIDSFTKLNCPQIELDKLRNDFPNTFFIVVFQSTVAGTARGGSAAEYDAGAVLQVGSGGMAMFEKNRYATDESQGKIYSVFEQKLIDPAAKIETEEPSEKEV